MPRKSRKFVFEQALTDLEAIVDEMENGELSLEDSLKAYEKGVALTNQCQQALKEAELKIQQLVNNKLEDFESDE